VGVEAVTAEGLKAVYKDFNCSGESLVRQLRRFREHGVHVLGSFIFGLPTDREDTFQATQELKDVGNSRDILDWIYPSPVAFPPRFRPGKAP